MYSSPRKNLSKTGDSSENSSPQQTKGTRLKFPTTTEQAQFNESEWAMKALYHFLYQVTSFLAPSMRLPEMLDCLECNWRLHVRRRRKQDVLAPKSCKPIHPRARPAIKVPIPVTFFCKGSINIWHRGTGHEGTTTR